MCNINEFSIFGGYINSLSLRTVLITLISIIIIPHLTTGQHIRNEPNEPRREIIYGLQQQHLPQHHQEQQEQRLLFSEIFQARDLSMYCPIHNLTVPDLNDAPAYYPSPMTAVFNVGRALLRSIGSSDNIPYDEIEHLLEKYLWNKTNSRYSTKNCLRFPTFRGDVGNRRVKRGDSGHRKTAQIPLQPAESQRYYDSPNSLQHSPTSDERSKSKGDKSTTTADDELTFSQIKTILKKLVSSQKGVVATLIAGLVVLILVPLIGLIYCFCRCCCNKCGARRYQKQPTSTGGCYGLVLAVMMCTFALICGILLFGFSGSTGLAYYRDQAVTDVKQQTTTVAKSYVSIIKEDMQCIAETSLNSVLQSLYDALYTLPNDSRNNLANLTGLTELIAARDGLEYLRKIGLFSAMNKSISEWDYLTDIEAGVLASLNLTIDQRHTITQELGQYNSTSFAQSLLEFENILDELKTNQTFDVIRVNETVEALDKAMKQVDDAIGPIRSEIRSTNASIWATMNNIINGTLGDILSQIDSISKTMSQLSTKDDDDNDKTFNQVKKTFNLLPKVIPIVMLPILAVVLCLIFGLLLGMCGHDSKVDRTRPYRRSGTSNAGGNCLIFAAVLSFISFLIIMLLAIGTFTAGYLVEGFVCEPFGPNSKPELKRSHDVTLSFLQEPQQGTGKMPSLRAMQFLDNTTIYHGVFHGKWPIINSTTYIVDSYATLNACRNDASVFNALGFSSRFNITDEVNNIFHRLDNIVLESTNLWGFNITDVMQISPGMAKWFRNMTVQKFTEISDIIQKFSDKLSVKPARTLEILHEIIEAGVPDRIKAVRFHRRLELTWEPQYQVPAWHQVNQLATNISSINASIVDALNRTSTRINHTAVLSEAYETFQSTVTQLSQNLHEYVTESISKIENDVGRCRPVYDAYANTADVVGCRRLAAPIHGAWMALGWSALWLLPTIVFATLLAKHLHCMEKSYYLAPANGSTEFDDLNGRPRGGRKGRGKRNDRNNNHYTNYSDSNTNSGETFYSSVDRSLGAAPYRMPVMTVPMVQAQAPPQRGRRKYQAF